MNMEKLKKCRICLVENVQMYLIANKNLQEIYEKLTDVPFVTDDSRPMLACFICCSKLKQCYQLQRKCLEAEELFAQMLNDDYATKPLMNQCLLEFCSGFTVTPTETISIVDECQTESIAIKEELPAVSEGQNDIIEPMEEHQIVELEWENLDNNCIDVADHSDSDLEYDVPLMEFKTEVEEEQEVFTKKRRARETTRATVAKKPNLETRRTTLEDAITAKETKEEKSDSKVIRTTQKSTSKPVTYFKQPYKCDQRSFKPKGDLTKLIRKHTGEKPYKCYVCQRSFSQKHHLKNHIRVHTGEKPYQCGVCQRSFSEKGALTRHNRVHTGEKPFKCDVCQRSFCVKSALTRHNRIHTGDKPYMCDVCKRSFSQLDSLKSHILMHTGGKPYKCDICQHSFRSKNNILKHIRIHSGEKPFKCDKCERSFRQFCHLTSHFKSQIHT